MCLVLLAAVLGNAATATKLQTARSINGTNFDGTSNITTTKWGTTRNIALTGAISGNANVDGSGNVTITTTQANIAVITGSMTGTGSKSLKKDIAFPSGYNNTNCVVLSAMFQRANSQNGTWGIGTTNDSASYIRGTIANSVYMNTSGVHIDCKNILLSEDSYPYIPDIDSTITFNYKIVLMKVS